MSEYLPISVLDQIAAGVAGFNDRTCEVRRPPTALDAAGQIASGATTVITTVDCRWEPAGARAIERIAGPRFGTEADIIAILPYATDCQNDDQITSGAITLVVVYAPSFFTLSNQAELSVLCRYLR